MQRVPNALLIVSILMVIGIPIVAYLGIYLSWAVHNRVQSDVLWLLVYKAILWIVAAIAGIRSATVLTRARICCYMGAVILAFGIVLIILTVNAGVRQDFVYLVLLVSIPLPLFYLIAAHKVKNKKL